MSIHLFLAGLALLAQPAAGGRYPESDGDWLPMAMQQGTASASGAAGQPAAPPTGIATLPPAVSPPPAIVPDRRANEIYSGAVNGAAASPIAPIDAGGGQVFPPGGAGTGPADNAPPPFELRQPPVSVYQSAVSDGLNADRREGSGDRAGRKPADLMRAMMSAPPGSQLSGEAVALDEVTTGATSRAEQMARVEAYWDVCVSVAEYYDCLRQLDEFRRLRQAAPRLNSAPDEIGATLSARRDAAERTALAAQHRLASMIGREAERLPLPMEAPHCGSYHTRYEQVFAGRPSPEADKLSRLIPMLHMQLQETCADVMRSEAWLSSLAAATKPAADGLTGELAGDAAFLPSWELHSLRRRAFLHYVRDYNRRIARYVELAAPGPIDSEQLIGMLVKRDVPAMATRPSGSPPRERQSSSDTRPPQTYVRGAGEWVPAGWSESASAQGGGPVTPASGQGAPLSPNERSLLVPRR